MSQSLGTTIMHDTLYSTLLNEGESNIRSVKEEFSKSHTHNRNFLQLVFLPVNLSPCTGTYTGNPRDTFDISQSSPNIPQIHPIDRNCSIFLHSLKYCWNLDAKSIVTEPDNENNKSNPVTSNKILQLMNVSLDVISLNHSLHQIASNPCILPPWANDSNDSVSKHHLLNRIDSVIDILTNFNGGLKLF